MTLCIGHGEGGAWVADVVRGVRPPFDPEACVREFAALLGKYRVSSVTGDNYAGAWAETAFRKAGIKYVRSDLPKSQLYLEAIPWFMRGAVFSFSRIASENNLLTVRSKSRLFNRS